MSHNEEQEPKVGDRRKRDNCPYCGVERFEEYRSFPIYHNDVGYAWNRVYHADYDSMRHNTDYGQCVENLNERLKRLEKIQE